VFFFGGRESHELVICVFISTLLGRNAAAGGHLKVLKYLRSDEHTPPCPWNAETLKAASFGGHFVCYNWAKENGCPTK